MGFSRNEVDELYIKSLTQVPVYVLLQDSTKQSQLSPGEFATTYPIPIPHTPYPIDFNPKALTFNPPFFSCRFFVTFLGESQKLFDMSDYIRNTSLPPKKQKSVPHTSLSVRVSFGEPFKIANTDGKDPTVESPCWCQLTLLKFVDVNVSKSSG